MQLRNAVIPLLALGLAGACTPQDEAANETADTLAVTEPAAPPVDAGAVKQQIEEANARFKAAWIRGDTAGMLANYADDAVAMGPGEPAAHGRDAMAKAMAGMLTQYTMKDATVHTEDVMVGGDLAVETGNAELTMVPKNGGKEMTQKVNYVTVWKQQPDGTWKIVRDINTPSEPPKQ